MPDIRELLSKLTPEDKQLWSQHRTEMRRSYMTAHNAVLGITAWTDFDDAFLDLIDTKLAQLFGSAGKLDAEDLVKHDDAERIENDIHDAISGMNKTHKVYIVNDKETKEATKEDIAEAQGMKPVTDTKFKPNTAVEKSAATASMQSNGSWPQTTWPENGAGK